MSAATQNNSKALPATSPNASASLPIHPERPTFATRTEARAGRALNPQEIFAINSARETALARMLMLYIGTGLFFMLLPGTFLGVWNLVNISSRAAADSVSAPWIQAHGQAQFFGWIGTFILGIGFHSIPKLRRREPFAVSLALTTYVVWTTGVALRWFTNVYQWHWRLLLPLSAALQLIAFAIFFHCVSGHKPPIASSQKPKFELWARIVIAATVGMALSLIANLGGTIWLAFYGKDPAFTSGFDARFLILTAWGFLVLFVWGFSTKWLPIFLGLRPTHERLLGTAAILNGLAIILAMFGFHVPASILLLCAAAAVPIALRLAERPAQPAKTNGVHRTFPVFVRIAYGWAIIAAALGIWASLAPHSSGIAGAGRHALTVGFIATMVFCVGQRVLPAFSSMRLLFSSKLMFAGLALLTAGCTLRVTAEVLAYQGYLASAWHWLPVSAVTELTAITLFAVNMIASFLSTPPSSRLLSIGPAN